MSKYNRIHPDGMHLPDVEMYLNGSEYDEIAQKHGLAVSTVCSRIVETFHKLVNHFDFKEKKIDYPHVKEARGGWKYKNARENKEFWLDLIAHYRNKTNPF